MQSFIDMDGLVELTHDEMVITHGGNWLSNLVANAIGGIVGIAYDIFVLGPEAMMKGFDAMMGLPDSGGWLGSGGGSSW